jgi:hypothetical protein
MALPADITIDIDAPPLRGVDPLAQLNNTIEECRILRTGLAALAASHNTLQTALDTLAAKLNADAGVTDVNYATNNAAGAVVTTTYATDSAHLAHKIHKH